MTRLWLVRLGKNGEREAAALEDNNLRIGFDLTEDISHLKDREALIGKMAELFPNDKPNKHRNFAAQINQFINVAETGDLVVTPFKTTGTIGIGRLAGPYKAGPNGEALRPIQWLKIDLPRDTFKQDLLYSFGAFMTVLRPRPGALSPPTCWPGCRPRSPRPGRCWSRTTARKAGRHAARPRARDQLDQRGTLDVLRHGVELLGLKQPLKLAQFKPALAINPDILARYAANRLRVVRQVRYSLHNENSIDLVLFLNGVPVATVELKTDFTQSVTTPSTSTASTACRNPRARPPSRCCPSRTARWCTSR
jgi:hypothetical protein